MDAHGDSDENGPPADIRRTFDRDPDRYERARPGYPPQLFDALFATLPDQPEVIEVGPGTGQATRELLERGAQVTAVELGANFCKRMRSTHPQVQVICDEFESAPLASHSFDAVVSATAYHWVRAEEQLARPHAVLRPGGRLAVIDLIQVGSPIDGGYFDRAQPVYAAFGQAKHDWSPPTHETAHPAIADRLRADDRFAAVSVDRAPWDQRYTTDQYRDLLMTYSGTLQMPIAARLDLLDQLTALIDDEFDGAITRPLVATLTLAQAR